MRTTALFLLLLFVLLGSCTNVNSQQNQAEVEPLPTVANTLFREVSSFPVIEDTSTFITNLCKIFNLEVEESSYQETHEKITAYQKIKLYGSDSSYVFIEYDYGDGSGATYPWKYQLILTTEGAPVKAMAGQRYELVEIFDNKNPFLLSVIVTSKGNGGHELYAISGDTLRNVYEGYIDYAVRTYDAHEDNAIYDPKELMFTVKDMNQDGFKDISFLGEIILIQGLTEEGDWYDKVTINGKTTTYSEEHPFKKIPIEFIFLYNQQTGLFEAKEAYQDIYNF